MTQPQNPYNMNDILLLLGQATVELAYLRAQMASLQAQLDERDQLKKEASPLNGVAAPEVLAAPKG